MSNRTSIKYPGATTSISKVHINNIYIKYTFVHFAILLIRQILGAVLLPVSSPFAVEALSFGLWSRLGFFPGAATCLLFFLKFPFFPLPFFLKLVVGDIVFGCNPPRRGRFIPMAVHQDKAHEDIEDGGPCSRLTKDPKPKGELKAHRCKLPYVHDLYCKVSV